MTLSINGISSMATRELLAELAATYSQRSGMAVGFESTGGVDAARRVAAGEAFDVVVLASDAIDKLAAAGQVAAAGRIDLARSGVAVAVPRGTVPPDTSTEEALRRAVLDAARIGYSTGPSGVALLALFHRWGIADRLEGRLVQAPPGEPVGALLARGEVSLGFQQLSELMHVEGIDLLGPLPPAVQIVTTFSAAACSASPRAAAVRALLDWMASPHTAEAKRRHGMEPA